MTDLSPATQAVWQQYCGIVEDHGPARLGLAAALRAAADQLINVEWSPEMWELRRDFYAIAAELEGQ